MNTLIIPKEHSNYSENDTVGSEDYYSTLQALCMYVDKLGIDLVITDLEKAQQLYIEQQNTN
jgi:hypothetical protein